MSRTQRSITLAAVAVLSVTVAACGGAGGGSGEAVKESGELSVDGEVIASADLMQAAEEEGAVNVYTSMNEVTNEAVAEAFEEDTGIPIEGIVIPTGELFERIESESGGGNFPADVVAMPDHSLFKSLLDDKMFTEHTVPADDMIPEEYKSPDDLYYALNSAPTVIAWNSEEIDDASAPKAWADLPAVARDSRFGMVHATQGAGGWGLALFMRDKFGTDYWNELAAAEPVLESSVGSLAERLGRGEVAVAAARPPEIGALKEQGAPVDYVWPEDGTPMFNFFIGQVADSDHPNAAQVYINWSLSKRGQSVLSAEGGDYPVHPEAAEPVVADETLPPMDEVKPYLAEPEKWISLRDKWIAEWEEVFNYRQ